VGGGRGHFRIKFNVYYFMSSHHKIAPNIVVYHLSIHHWLRDVIFLANTYMPSYIHGGFVCFCKKTLVAFVCFCRKTYLGIVKQSLLEEHCCFQLIFFKNGVVCFCPWAIHCSDLPEILFVVWGLLEEGSFQKPVLPKIQDGRQVDIFDFAQSSIYAYSGGIPCERARLC
jgi:hypothetical protein